MNRVKVSGIDVDNTIPARGCLPQIPIEASPAFQYAKYTSGHNPTKPEAVSEVTVSAFKSKDLLPYLLVPHAGIVGKLGIASGIAERETLICEIREVLVVDTEVVVEGAEVDKEKDDLVWEREEVLGIMRKSKKCKMLVDFTIRGVWGPLPT